MPIPSSLRLPILLLVLAPILSMGAGVPKAIAAGTGDTPTRYTITDLGTLPGGRISVAFGINNTGQVIGSSIGPGPGGEAFLYSNGKMTGLGRLNGDTMSGAYGINDKGEIVGASSIGIDYIHAVLFHSGITNPTNLGSLGGNENEANGINANGVIVGESSNDASGVTHAFVYISGKMKPLGTQKGDKPSQATAINDKGQIVGTSYVKDLGPYAVLFQIGSTSPISLGTLPGDTSSRASANNNAGQIVGDSQSQGLHAVLFHLGSKPTDLGTLGGMDSTARAINASGQIVGSSSTADGVSHAALFRIGSTTPINLETCLSAADQAKWKLDYASGINNKGQICGFGKINGQHHAFLLTPVSSGR